MKLYRYGVLGLCLLLPAAALADFQYQETTQITGGSLLGLMKFAGHFSKQASQANAPTVSTVYVQGNRMARVNPQTITIIDLDAGTITNVDLVKHTYTQMTFDQMRQAMEQGMQQAQARMAQQKASAPPEKQLPPNVKLDFKVNVRNTGASKQVSGVNASESILTMLLQGTDTDTGKQGAFAITSDMWMAPDIPGYDELRAFNRKMAEKMGDLFDSTGMMAQLRAMQPAASQGMSDLIKESSKLKGIPVQQVMRMGATTNGQPLPAASEAPLPSSPSGPEMPSAGDVAQDQANNVATQTTNNAIASKLGKFGVSGFSGFHGFGHKKQQTPPPQQDAATTQQQPPTSTVMMELTTELTSFSSAPIDSGKFSVPAGYQQVQPPTMQRATK